MIIRQHTAILYDARVKKMIIDFEDEVGPMLVGTKRMLGDPKLSNLDLKG